MDLRAVDRPGDGLRRSSLHSCGRYLVVVAPRTGEFPATEAIAPTNGSRGEVGPSLREVCDEWNRTMKRPAKRSAALRVQALEPRTMMDAQGLVGTWLGQDRHDFVGPSSVLGPSGVQDIHIALNGLPAGRSVVSASVGGLGGGEWLYRGHPGPWAAALVRSGSTTADVYLEPYQVETGRPFAVELRFDDGSSASTWLNGGTASPSVRMPDASLEVAWIGQDGADRVGPGPSVGPDGVQDFRLQLTRLSPDVAIESVYVIGPPGISWRAGLNPQGDSNAELIRSPSDPRRAELYLNPDRNLEGQDLSVLVVYASGATDEAHVLARATNPALRVAPAPALPTRVAGLSAQWLGQDGLDLASKGEVHLSVAGIPTARTVVAAVLSNVAGTSWVARTPAGSSVYADPFARTLGLRRSGATTADVTFAPVRDETGEPLQLRLVFDDGSIGLVDVAGGSSDLSRLAAQPAATAVDARPGDSLQDLVNRFGTVRLKAGTYLLEQPLVLSRPVSLLGEPGAVIRFRQRADGSEWTTAIKVHAGNTTLDGFAVRFDGPVRWDREVQFGPAVIGTTDSRDVDTYGPRVNLTFTDLDLESPAASTAWEAAPLLFRLLTAAGGRIERNVLKGGMTEFRDGPWRIAANDYLGTPTGTYADAVFAGQDTYDLELVENRAEPRGSSGKTWRFLVLTRAGLDDRIAGNTVVGIGPRDTDTVPSANAAEVVLTEAYRLRFEGSPLAVSADRRIVQIPTPQGEPARAGDIVAVLSGPNAGQWRTVVQALDTRTVVLDAPLPDPAGALSISTGFVDLDFEDNRIDSRGSSVAANLVLVGAQFGTSVVDNTLLGGRDALYVAASASEEPVHWGWSRTPFFDVQIQGNRIEDAVRGAAIRVEHGGAIKSSKDRVYLTGSVGETTFAWSSTFLAAHPQPSSLTIGDLASLDPSELVLNFVANQALEPGSTVVVHSATVNGKALVDATIPLALAPPAAPTGLGLVFDTGTSSTDGLTNYALLRFDPVAGASSYQYRVGSSGTFLTAASPAGFFPAGLAQGVNRVVVRALNRGGRAGAETAFTFTYDTTAPGKTAPMLLASSDTGLSASDRITSDGTPSLSAVAEATDLVILRRNGLIVSWRQGPGVLTDDSEGPDGAIAYRITRTDSAGNSSLSDPLNVTIDTEPPDRVSDLSADLQGIVSYRATGPQDRYEIRVGSGSFVSIGSQTRILPSGLGPGANAVAVRAIDVAGNVGPEATLSVLIPWSPPTGTWLGQDGADLASRGPARPDGALDVHIRLDGLPVARTITTLLVEGLGGGAWSYGQASPHWAAVVERVAGSARADVYFQPYQVETGRPYHISLTYDDGTTAGVWIQGGPIDPKRSRSPVPAASLSASTVGSGGIGAFAPRSSNAVPQLQRGRIAPMVRLRRLPRILRARH